MSAANQPEIKLPVLGISVKRGAWRVEDPHHSTSVDAEFAEARRTVLVRDEYKCRYCRFLSPPSKEAQSWQEVHHVDGDHKRQDHENLATVCPLCHGYFHVGLLGIRGAARFVLLPEMTPEAFNHVQRGMWLLAESVESPATSLPESVCADARELITEFNILMANRSIALESMLGAQTAEPAFLGGIMRSVDEEDYALISNAFHKSGVRLLFDARCYQDQMTAYKRNAAVYGQILPPSWLHLAKAALQRAEAMA